MRSEDFENLVRRLQADALRRPKRYRWKVFLVALLGQAWMMGVSGSVLLLFLLSTLGMLLKPNAGLFQLMMIFGGLSWLIVKSMQVSGARPEGLPVSAAQAPQLFARLSQLRKVMGAPRIHRVLITNELNASVYQQPRFGPLGISRNFLMLGVPLMRCLSVPQLEAVLAHELGHLSGRHNRFSNYIYRLRLRWHRLLDTMEHEGVGSWLFAPFFKRYEPWFNAYSFPLAQSNEYEADAQAAQTTSPRAAAQALTASEVASRWLQRHYWPAVQQRAKHEPQAPDQVYTAMLAGSELAQAPELADWVEEALAEKTGLADTHPALGDRLRALGVSAELQLPAAGESAFLLLQPVAGDLLRQLDERWQRDVQSPWGEIFAEAQQQRARLSELRGQEAVRALTPSELYDLACLIDSVLEDTPTCMAQLTSLLARCPAEPAVFMALGVRRLQQDREDGRGLVELAATLDPQYGPNAARQLRDHFWRIGDTAAAHQWQQRSLERQEQERVVQDEWQAMRLGDHFLPHDLPPETRAALVAALKGIAGIRAVYLVKKQLRSRPQVSYYVLGIVPSFRLVMPEAHTRSLCERAVNLPEVTFTCHALIIYGPNKAFADIFAKRKGARIL